MKRTKILGLALIAAFAISVVAASAASATTGQNFKKAGTTNGFTDKSGVSVLVDKTGGITITCKKDTSSGTLAGNGLAGATGITVTFEECKVKGSSKECPINSSGAAAETITTNVLKGELGGVAVSESATEVGELLEPESNSEFVKLAEAKNAASEKCSPATAVTGSVAAEVTPIEKLQLTGELVFAVNSTPAQKIKTIERSTGGSVSPKLTAFGNTSTFESKDEVTFKENTEVVK